jgi:uncharacterized protein (DUF58 family)
MAPGARRPKSRVARLTWRGWLLLASGILAFIVAYVAGRPEFLWLGAFLVVLPGAAWVFVRLRPLRFTVARQFAPSVIAAGRMSEVILDIANVSRYRSPVANWRDTWPWRPFVTVPRPIDSLVGSDPGRVILGSVVRLAYSVMPTRRGLFAIGPLIVDFTDPFGLADGAVSAHGTGQLTVTPAVVELPEGTVAIAADEGATRLRRRRSFGGQDDLMTREYRQGDAMRRVHWRASAHHGELMVRQEEQRSHAEARIVLDTVRGNYRDSRGGGDGAESEPESEMFEWAVSLCTSLSLYLVDRGFVVQVSETGKPQLAPVDQLDEFLESLAAVQLSPSAAPGMSLLRPGARPDRPQGTIFAILTDGVASDAIDRMVAQRGSFELAVAFIVGPTALLGARAPSSMLGELRAAGWICVAASPNITIEEAWHAVGAEQELLNGSR